MPKQQKKKRKHSAHWQKIFPWAALVVLAALLFVALRYTTSTKNGPGYSSLSKQQLPNDIYAVFYTYHDRDSTHLIGNLNGGDLRTVSGLDQKGERFSPDFRVSPDGRFILARAEQGDEISISTSANPDTFTPLARTDKPNEVISSTVWSSDSTQFAYVVTEYALDETGQIDPFDERRNTYYVMHRDGSRRLLNLVTSDAEEAPNNLLEFDSKTGALYVARSTDDASIGQVYAYDTDTGEQEVYDNFVGNFKVVFTPDFSGFYYMKFNDAQHIWKYQFSNNSSHAVYTSPEDDGFLEIRFFEPLADNKTALLLDRSAGRDELSVFQLNLGTGETELIASWPDRIIQAHYLSPDERFLWLDVRCPRCGKNSTSTAEIYIFDRTTGQMSLFAQLPRRWVDQPRNVVEGADIYFKGWLKVD